MTTRQKVNRAFLGIGLLVFLIGVILNNEHVVGYSAGWLISQITIMNVFK